MWEDLMGISRLGYPEVRLNAELVCMRFLSFCYSIPRELLLVFILTKCAARGEDDFPPPLDGPGDDRSDETVGLFGIHFQRRVPPGLPPARTSVASPWPTTSDSRTRPDRTRRPENRNAPTTPDQHSATEALIPAGFLPHFGPVDSLSSTLGSEPRDGRTVPAEGAVAGGKVSVALAERLRTGPTVLVEGSTIHYIPLLQPIQPVFSLPGMMYHQDDRAIYGLPPLPPHLVSPAPLPLGKHSRPGPPSQSAASALHWQPQGQPYHLWGGQPGRFQTPGGRSGELLVQKKSKSMEFSHQAKGEGAWNSAKTRGLVLQPGLIEMMKAMDRSILSYPSRFEYRTSLKTLAPYIPGVQDPYLRLWEE